MRLQLMHNHHHLDVPDNVSPISDTLEETGNFTDLELRDGSVDTTEAQENDLCLQET